MGCAVFGSASTEGVLPRLLRRRLLRCELRRDARPPAIPAIIEERRRCGIHHGGGGPTDRAHSRAGSGNVEVLHRQGRRIAERVGREAPAQQRRAGVSRLRRGRELWRHGFGGRRRRNAGGRCGGWRSSRHHRLGGVEGDGAAEDGAAEDRGLRSDVVDIFRLRGAQCQSTNHQNQY